MPSPTCPLCYNLDIAKLQRLTENTCSMGQAARHWMRAKELRASAIGVGGTDHSGVYRRFMRSCETCALLRDAVESFLGGSGLAGSESRGLDYLVAVQGPDEDSEGGGGEEGTDDGSEGEEGADEGSEGEEGADEGSEGEEGTKEESEDEGGTDEGSEVDNDTHEGTEDEEDNIDGSGSDIASESSWEDVDSDFEDDVDVGDRDSQSLTRPPQDKKESRRLRLVMRCNLNRSKAKGEDDTQEEFELEVFTPDGDISPSLSIVGKAGEVPTALDPHGYATIIKEWLQECLGHHSTCQGCATIDKPKPLPKRVLDLSNDKIVLIETGYKKDVYVALSHSWGKEQILVATKETMADHMKDIPFNKLPQTFQDTVQITRALGLRYLWIDSLCIIQKDTKDWEDQSAVMADIYAGCYLNIATTRSSSGNEGFITPRWTSRNTWEWARHFTAAISRGRESKPVSKIRKCDVESYTVSSEDDPDRYSDNLKVRLTLNSSHESMQTFRWISMHKDTAPLIQRGWVYQERNLAPRTIHFHSNEMMWDCADQQRCECSTLDSLEIGGDGWSASKSRISTLGSLDQSQLHGLWRTMMEDYCLLDLTYESDRLPALAGLATRFSEHLPQDEYLAGLWKSTLGRDLLWQVDGESKVPQRWQLGDKTPPSWSWASLVYGEGRPTIRWEYETKPKLASWAETSTYKQDPRFSVVRASCSLTSTSVFGNVSGGSITVTGAMCAIAIVRDTAPFPRGWTDQIPIVSKDCFNSLHLNYDDPKDKDWVTSSENLVHGLIFCLFIGTFFSHFDHDTKNTHPELKGLMLKPSAAVAGAAERIGSWDQHIEFWTSGKSVFLKKAATVTVTIV